MDKYRLAQAPRDREGQLEVLANLQEASKNAGALADVYDLADGDIAKMYLYNAGDITRRYMRNEVHYLRELAKLDKSFRTPTLVSENWYPVRAIFDEEHPEQATAYMGSVVMENVKGRNSIPLMEFMGVRRYGLNQQQIVKEDEAKGVFLAEFHRLKPEPLDRKRTVLETVIDDAMGYDTDASKNRKFYRALVKRLGLMESASPHVFCHGDLARERNMFFTRGLDVASVIDFTDSGYGMPETDGAISRVSDKSEVQLFNVSYEKRTGYRFDPEKKQMSELIKTMRALLTCKFLSHAKLMESTEDLEDRNVEEINAVAKELGVPHSFHFTPN